jgi:hypothetical protein
VKLCLARVAAQHFIQDGSEFFVYCVTALASLG